MQEIETVPPFSDKEQKLLLTVRFIKNSWNF